MMDFGVHIYLPGGNSTYALGEGYLLKYWLVAMMWILALMEIHSNNCSDKFTESETNPL